MAESKSKKKQFDLSEIRVDPRLQGANLAGFFRRALAFLLDWIILSSLIAFEWLTVILIGLYFLKKNTFKQIISGKIPVINEGLELLNSRMENYKTDRRLRYNFIRYTRVYLHILVYVWFFVSVAAAVLLAAGSLKMGKFAFLESVGESDFMLLSPIQNLSNLFTFIGGSAAPILYFSFFTWKWKGQTPGKRLMGIRVVKLNGEDITLWNSFERMSGYVSSASLFLLGFFQYFWERNHQTTHDKICETIVITGSVPEKARDEEVTKEKTEEEESDEV